MVMMKDSMIDLERLIVSEYWP